MNTTNQLIAQSHPQVADSVRKLDEEAIEGLLRRLVALVESNLLVHPALNEYFLRLQATDTFSCVKAESLQRIAEELDKEYFELQEEGASEVEWCAKFHQARLASAFAQMAGGPSQANVSDILYEFANAYDPPGILYRRIASILSIS